jgi:hypothetical protein
MFRSKFFFTKVLKKTKVDVEDQVMYSGGKSVRSKSTINVSTDTGTNGRTVTEIRSKADKSEIHVKEAGDGESYLNVTANATRYLHLGEEPEESGNTITVDVDPNSRGNTHHNIDAVAGDDGYGNKINVNLNGAGNNTADVRSVVGTQDAVNYTV